MIKQELKNGRWFDPSDCQQVFEDQGAKTRLIDADIYSRLYFCKDAQWVLEEWELIDNIESTHIFSKVSQERACSWLLANHYKDFAENYLFDHFTIFEEQGSEIKLAERDTHKRLYMCKDGRWILEEWREISSTRESRRIFIEIDKQEACKWLLFNEYVEVAEQFLPQELSKEIMHTLEDEVQLGERFADKIRFLVRQEHIKLLRNMYVSWNDSCGYGAPMIDPKRPYGNSYWFWDVAVILGMRVSDESEDDKPLTQDEIKTIKKLHRELETVLQIFLVTGEMKPGKYIADEYDNNWELENLTTNNDPKDTLNQDYI